MLNQAEKIAEESGYHTFQIEAHEGKKLGPLLSNSVRALLLKLDRIEGAKEKVKRGFAVLKSFVGSVKVTYEDVSFGLNINPELGTADSGDIELDLPDVFVALGEAAKAKNSAVAIFIDELQYFDEKELSALIMGMHKMQQKQLPLVLIGAGLPILPRLAGDSKSYAERLFHFPKIGALSAEDSASALRNPIEEEGSTISDEALDRIFEMTQGYPYFIQEWGYQVWNYSQSENIIADVVDVASDETLDRLDQNFFRVRFDRLKPGEKKMLRAMAELGPGPYQMGEVAKTMNVKINSLGPRRAKMLSKAMIYSPAYGKAAFTVPLFDEFLKREMPEL